MPLRRSMDLKATACSRLRVKRLNFQTRITWKGGGGLAALVDHVAELGPVGDAAALGLVHVLAGDGVAVVLGKIPQGPKLGGHGQVHVLTVAGDPGVQGRRGKGLYLTLHVVLRYLYLPSLTKETLNKWGELWHSREREMDSVPGVGSDGPACFEPAHFCRPGI